MNKNQNKYENVKIYIDNRDYNYINCNICIVQMKAAGIPTPTILKTILIIFKLCMILYDIIQF